MPNAHRLLTGLSARELLEWVPEARPSRWQEPKVLAWHLPTASKYNSAMTDDPAEGVNPKDIEELDRLFKGILEQSGIDREVFATDAVGITDSVSIAVTPGTVGGRADIPIPGVVLAEVQATTQATLTVTALVIPATVDGPTFDRMLDLARKLAKSIGAGYLGNAIYDGTHDQFIDVLHFVALVLSYLRPYL